MVRDGFGDRGQVRRRGEDRGVVGVVGGAEKDGSGRRIDRGQGDRRAVAHRGVGQRVGGLHLVAMHQRDDRHRVVAGRPVGTDDQRLVMRVRPVGVPPRALEGPTGEDRRPGGPGCQGIPGRLGDVGHGAPLGVQLPGTRSCRPSRVGEPDGARTGRLREGRGGHHPDSSTGKVLVASATSAGRTRPGIGTGPGPPAPLMTRARRFHPAWSTWTSIGRVTNHAGSLDPIRPIRSKNPVALDVPADSRSRSVAYASRAGMLPGLSGGRTPGSRGPDRRGATPRSDRMLGCRAKTRTLPDPRRITHLPPA